MYPLRLTRIFSLTLYVCVRCTYIPSHSPELCWLENEILRGPSFHHSFPHYLHNGKARVWHNWIAGGTCCSSVLPNQPVRSCSGDYPCKSFARLNRGVHRKMWSEESIEKALQDATDGTWNQRSKIHPLWLADRVCETRCYFRCTTLPGQLGGRGISKMDWWMRRGWIC